MKIPDVHSLISNVRHALDELEAALNDRPNGTVTTLDDDSGGHGGTNPPPPKLPGEG